MRSRLFSSVLFALLQCGLGSTALAQSWPSRPVTVVVPYPPGGLADLTGRLYAERLAAVAGQATVVDNRAGAAGIVGTAYVARSAPDGYTMLLGNNGTHVIQPLVSATASYDPVRDFTPLGTLTDAPQLLGVNVGTGLNSLAELIALAKREPGKLNYGSAGSGSFGNFGGELLKLMAGIDIVHVPYKGSGPAVLDLMAGRIQVMLDPAVLTQVKSGRVKVLATTGPTRFVGLPEVPTMSEAGLPGFQLIGWFGIFGPRNLPREVVAKAFVAVTATVQDPEFQKRVIAAGVTPSLRTPDAMAALLKSDLALYGDIKKRANIQVVE